MPLRGYNTRTMILICCLIALMFSGCGRLNKETGSIRGQVVDKQGVGLGSVAVTIGKLGITSLTDSSGWYQLDRIPVGTHTVTAAQGEVNSGVYSSAANLNSYHVTMSDDSLSFLRDGRIVSHEEVVRAATATAQGSVQVVVRNGVTSSADPIILLPSDVKLDNIVIYQADPDPDTDVLTSGSEREFSFDVAYTTDSLTGVLIVALYPTGGDTPIKYWYTELNKAGSGARALGGKAALPAVNSITAEAFLLDGNDDTLAVSVAGNYAVVGGSLPRAPYLQINWSEFSHVDVSWRGGNTTGFQKYEIWRNSYKLATITDTNVKSYRDLFPEENTENRYEIRMYLDQYSQAFLSNSMTTTVRSYGMTPVNAAYSPVTTVSDPVRDNVYVAWRHRNVISKMTMDGQISANVEVCTSPNKLAVAGDGSLLAVMCPLSETVVVVDLTSFTVTKTLRGFTDLAGIAVDSTGDRVYIGAGSGLSYFDFASGKLETPATLGYKYVRELILSPDDQALYMRANSGVVAVNTAGFTASWTISSYGLYQLVLDSSRNRLYDGYLAYDTTTGAKTDTLSYQVLNLSADGAFLYCMENMGLSVREHQGDSWQIVDRLSLIDKNSEPTLGVNNNSTKAIALLHSAQAPALYAIDLLARYQARQEAL